MTERAVTILKSEPTIEIIASMLLDWTGIVKMADWVEAHRPECVPYGAGCGPIARAQALFPHDMTDPEDGRCVTDNELLVELAGRKCYDSFGAKAGKKSNREYIENTQSGAVPHASILYHAKMTFFFSGISRRVSHEIIRNYVGADRDEEGSPSQESTRFTHHYGFFICPPWYLNTEMELTFERSMKVAYSNYTAAVDIEFARYRDEHGGENPLGIDRKRIYEAASAMLPHQAETSFLWTTNPAAIAKFVREREDPSADLEIQRFARTWRRVVMRRAPNLFPQPWMHRD